MDNSLLEAVREGLIVYMIFMASLCLRGWFQAFVADKLGDVLPRLQGRVTLNPFVHMDLMGSVVFPLLALSWPIFFGGGMAPLFGWSRPIELALNDPKTRVRNEVLIAAAGPGLHLVLSFILALAGGAFASVWPHLTGLFMIALQINAALFVFNLLPLPPFDGGTLLRYAIKMREEVFETLSRYSFFIFLILITIPFTRMLIGVAIHFVMLPFYLLFSTVLGYLV